LIECRCEGAFSPGKITWKFADRFVVVATKSSAPKTSCWISVSTRRSATCMSEASRVASVSSGSRSAQRQMRGFSPRGG
jgi:hypothetical protein